MTLKKNWGLSPPTHPGSDAYVNNVHYRHNQRPFFLGQVFDKSSPPPRTPSFNLLPTPLETNIETNLAKLMITENHSYTLIYVDDICYLHVDRSDISQLFTCTSLEYIITW